MVVLYTSECFPLFEQRQAVLEAGLDNAKQALAALQGGTMRTLAALLTTSAFPLVLSAQAGLHWEKPDPKPSSGRATDALSQLEALSGGKVDRSKLGTTFKVRPPALGPKAVRRQPTANQQAASLMGGIFGSLLAQAFAPTGPSGSDPAELAHTEAERQEALRREQAALQAWASAYSSRMGALVEHQRQQRASQNQQSMEDLRASLSNGWDSGGAQTGGGLAAALSDPAPAVDLSESQTYTPSILREADGTKRAVPMSPDDLLKRREAAQARLKAMMAENQDLRLLGQRFYELETRLNLLRRQARDQGSDGRAIQREMDYWGWRIEQTAQACMERGMSLFTDVLLPKGTTAGLKRLQKNPKLWGQTVQSLSEINDFSEFAGSLADRYDAAGLAIDWVQAKHSLMKNVDFMATNAQNVTSKLEPISLHWQVGKALVGTSVDLAAEIDGWGAILERQGDISLLLQKQKTLKVRIEAVVKDLQASRAQIAARLGVKPEDLIPVQARPKGLGSSVPHL